MNKLAILAIITSSFLFSACSPETPLTPPESPNNLGEGKLGEMTLGNSI